MTPVAYVYEQGRKPRPVYTTFLADLMRDAGMEVKSC